MKWIDVVKGLGILLVVAGHIFIGDVSRLIYVFHMPLFFIVGGMLFKINHDKIGFFYKKIVHLILPYFSFLLLIKIAQWSVYWVSDDYQIESYFVELAGMALGGAYLTGWTGVFWFVTCFFVTQQLANYILCEFSSRNAVLTFIIMYGFATANSAFFPSIRVPLGLNFVLISAPFFYIGYLYKNASFGLERLLGVVVLLIGAGLFVSGFDIEYDIKYTKYGIPIFSFLLSTVIVFYLIEVIKYGEKYSLLSQCMAVFGSASMVIMYLHQPIQLGMKEIAGVNDQYLRFFASVLISLAVYFFMKRFVVFRAIFLGDKDAFDELRESPPQSYPAK